MAAPDSGHGRADHAPRFPGAARRAAPSGGPNAVTSPSEPTTVQLSVIIATLNPGRRLFACLEGLARQEGVDGAFEVIIIDDGSQPPIDSDIRSVGDRHPLRVIRRDRPGGIAVARNAGWPVAHGRICLFLDDDIEVDPQLVAGHIAAHASAELAIGIGRLRTTVVPRAEWFMKQVALAWNANVETMDAGRPLSPTDCSAGNLSVPTELLRTTGGFDEALASSQGVELSARFLEAGARLVYVPGDNTQRELKTARQVLSEQRRSGEAGLDLFERHPQLLPALTLGGFAAAGQRDLLVRRVATTLGLSPEVMLPVAGMLNGGRRADSVVYLMLALAYWRGVRARATSDEFARMSDGAAILMYHALSPARTSGSRFVLPVDRFEAQLSGLLRRGYRPMTLSAYLEHRAANRFPPPRSLVVTIDDAYAEVEDLAAPVLRRLGIPATLFVVEGRLGLVNDWSRQPPMLGRPILNEAAVERLRGHGFELAAHASTHVPLAGLPADRIAEEVGASYQRLEARFGPLVPAFAYPFGVLDAAVKDAVADAGLIGIGVSDGLASPASPSFELPRIEVRGTDSPFRLAVATRLGGTRHLLPGSSAIAARTVRPWSDWPSGQ